MPRVTTGSWAHGRQAVPTDWKCSLQICRLELELYFEKFYGQQHGSQNKLLNQLLWELPSRGIKVAESHDS